jgi:hypothetical protein
VSAAVTATKWQDRPSNAPLVDGERLPPPPIGHVWVEWVGEASPLDSPVVRHNLLLGKYSPEQEAVIRRLMEVRIARAHRHTRTVRRGNGLGQIPALGVAFVRFGPDQRKRPGQPGSFIQAVPFRAADAVKASEAGHEFVIHNERDGEQQSHLRLPDGRIKIVSEQQFADFGGFRRAMGW